MRKLMWFTIGLGAACAVCACFWLTEGLMLPAVMLAGAFGALILPGKRVKQLRPLGMLCLGAAAGLGWFGAYAEYYLAAPAALDGCMETVTIQCTDYGYETDYGSAAEGFLDLDGTPYRVKFYLDDKEYLAQPGDTVSGSFRFRVTTPDGSDEATAHQGKGIFLLAYEEEGIQTTTPEEAPYWTFPARLRRTLTQILDACIPEDAASFAKALLLGDRSGIGYELNTAFKISGISHVIAVSGLHVTILFTLVEMLCFKRRRLVALVGIPVLALFAAVAGFSPSVVRASIMQALMMLASLVNREYDAPTELAAACLVMLGVNPLVITSVSFQLSVGCMVGIFLFQKRIADWICGKLGCGKGAKFLRIKRSFAGSVSVSLSAMAVTTPLVAYYFDTVSLIGVVTNLLTLWVISLIFYLCILVCLSGWLLPGIAPLIGMVVAVPIRYVLAAAKLLSGLPMAAVYTQSVYIVAWLVFCYLLLALFLLLRGKQPVVLACCAILGLCLALTFSWIEPVLGNCRLTVLDVGQGQCILLQSDGATFVVDCGGSRDEDAADLAAQTLLSQGIAKIDGLILTHFDRDHAGGAAMLMSRIDTAMLIVPDCVDEDGVLATLEQYDPEQVIRVSEDICLSFGGAEMKIFAPVIPDSGNESSLALLFQRENCDILITGDRGSFGERMLLRSITLPKIEVLVAGHHGSWDSNSEELLAAARPENVMISVGENSYGHPSQEALERFEKYGCTVYRTDLNGDLIYRG